MWGRTCQTRGCQRRGCVSVAIAWERGFPFLPLIRASLYFAGRLGLAKYVQKTKPNANAICSQVNKLLLCRQTLQDSQEEGQATSTEKQEQEQKPSSSSNSTQGQEQEPSSSGRHGQQGWKPSSNTQPQQQ